MRTITMTEDAHIGRSGKVDPSSLAHPPVHLSLQLMYIHLSNSCPSISPPHVHPSLRIMSIHLSESCPSISPNHVHPSLRIMSRGSLQLMSIHLSESCPSISPNHVHPCLRIMYIHLSNSCQPASLRTSVQPCGHQ